MEPKDYIYRIQWPGTRIPLFTKDGEEFKRPDTKGTTVVFKDTGKGENRSGIFITKDKSIAEAVERNKRFKSGHIIRLKTAEEIEYETMKRKQRETLEKYKALVEQELFAVDKLTSMKDVDLQEFSKNIGVDTHDDNGKRKKADVLADCLKALGLKVPKKEEKEDE